MPTSEDWAFMRGLVIMAIIAVFLGPWTWQMLLLTALLVWVVTTFIESL